MLELEELAQINGLIAALLTQQVNGNIGKGVLEAYSAKGSFFVTFERRCLCFVRKDDGFRLVINVEDQIGTQQTANEVA